MDRTAIVIGCGGTIGGAWAIAALHALAEQTGSSPVTPTSCWAPPRAPSW